MFLVKRPTKCKPHAVTSSNHERPNPASVTIDNLPSRRQHLLQALEKTALHGTVSNALLPVHLRADDLRASRHRNAGDQRGFGVVDVRPIHQDDDAPA